MNRQIVSPSGAPSNPLLSPGVRVGDFIWTAGHVGRNPETGKVDGDISVQTRRTLEGLKETLEAGGSSLQSVIKVNIYLVNISDRPAMNEVYREFFPSNPPSRTTIGGAQLEGPLVEIEAVAVADS